MSNYSRRTVVRGAAWSVPVIAIAAPIPAFAASYPPVIITGYTDAYKCPGQSSGGNNNSYTYIFEFTASGTVTADQIAGLVVVINGTSFNVKYVNTVANGDGTTTLYVVTQASTNSADGTGTLSFTYQSGDPVQTVTAGPFPYNGTHPNQQLCGSIAPN